MPCYHPLRAFKTAGGDVVFNELRRHDIAFALSLPCGQCAGCRLERSRQWAIRCVHEASLWPQNSFITLTYEDAHLPADGSLKYLDYQLFMKRLRKAFSPQLIRFYMAGEYGTETFRPHYHACIFNCGFQDKQLLKTTPAGSRIYTSPTLNKLWPYGLSSIGDVNFQSAAYCARYLMEKRTGQNSEEHYRRIDPDTGEIHQLTPEFNKMSLKPGIGAGWFSQFKRDVYPHDFCIINGKEVKPPKFYDKLFERENPEDAEYIFFLRELDGRAQYTDNTEERLKVKEAVALAGLQQFSRN